MPLLANPFQLAGPALLSFSGGRTSAYMLRQCLDAHGGKLPADVHVCFFNTGKEREETLDFVTECELRWEAPIAWLEYRHPVHLPHRPADKRIDDHTAEVMPHHASTAGEPFEALIRAKSYLPNVVTRFCTAELKVRRGKSFMLSKGYEHWTNAVGIRADEPHRLGNEGDTRERWDRIHPLAEAGAVLEDVMHFWRQQRGGRDLEEWLADADAGGFDLRLRPEEGNCDLCFLKGRLKLLGLIERRPQDAKWWQDMEAYVADRAPGKAVAQFSSRRSYVELQQWALHKGPLFAPRDPDDEVQGCNCTD